MTNLRTFALALALGVLPACTSGEASTASGPAAAADTAGVQRLTSAVHRDANALNATGTLRVPGVSSQHDVSYQVVGTPAAAPELYDARVTDVATGADARLTWRPDWRAVSVEIGGHSADLAHNPDGSFSASGRTFASLSEATHALVADPALSALSAELVVAATVALGDAVLTANTRIADGWCDPLWFGIDPDCKQRHVALPVAFGEAYTCERWTQSESCAFYQALGR